MTAYLLGLLTTHWSKNGSKIMTSSPGSMKPMNALSIPDNWGIWLVYTFVRSESSLTLIRARGDGDLCLGIQGPAEERRVCIRNGLLKTRTALFSVRILPTMFNSLGRSLPLSGNTGCIPPGPAHPWPRQGRTWGDYNHCFSPLVSLPLLYFHVLATHKNPWPIFTIG
jgi:hypothetical protein